MAQISLELHIFKPHIIKKGNPGTRVLSLQKPKPIRCKKPGFKPGSGTRVQSLGTTRIDFIFLTKLEIKIHSLKSLVD